VECRTDLVFARPGGGPLELDLYLPIGIDGPVPVALFVHGGGWIVGSRKEFGERCSLLAEEGVAVAAVDYRLSGVAAFPAQVEDLRAAVSWLRENGTDHGLGTERLGVWGASAGGHLAALLALAPEPTEATRVQAAVCWFGPSDLTPDGLALAPDPACPPPAFLETVQMPLGVGNPPDPPVEARLLGVADVTEAPELARRASPLMQVRGAAPPLLICHGDRDGLVAIEHSTRLHEAVIGAGGTSTMLVVAGANHEDERFDQPAVIGAVAGFFRRHLHSDDACPRFPERLHRSPSSGAIH